MSAAWGRTERVAALRCAERDGVDVLVVGGGITGAGVLRDVASRGLRAFLVERRDFAAGTSSRSSKLIHGGLRYIAEGQLGTTREACRERDLLMRQNPNLVRPIPFLFPAYKDSKVPLWQVRAALWVYAALANFRSTSRFEMLSPEAAARYSRDLCREGLEGAGLYHDGQVDDARLVLETLKSARSLGGDAANHADVIEFLRDDDGRLTGARVRDRIAGRTHTIRAHAFVNAAGPAVERVRGLDCRGLAPELRPAKGVHLLIRRDRIHADAAVSFEGPDRRHMFLAPWDDLLIIGTTDTFTDEIDEPVVTIEEVHYLLAAANAAFPLAALTTNDIVSVYAGVRPLVAPGDASVPPSSVSRESRIYEDPSGLVSVVGGKLTTYRAMAESVVDRVLPQLPVGRRRTAGSCRTAELPLRDDAFERESFEADLAARFGLDARRAAYLVRTYGAAAETLLAEAEPAWRRPIGRSRHVFAEVPWSFRSESPAGLCDLLEHRLRMALFSVSQGLPEIREIARVAASVTGWDEARQQEQIAAYADSLRRQYQIVPPRELRRDASARSAA